MNYDEYRLDKIKQSAKKKIIISIIICISVIIAVGISVFVYLFNGNKNTQNTKSIDISVNSGERTFCIVCTDDEENNIYFISLIKAQLYNKTFYITMLEPNSGKYYDTGDQSLVKHFTDGGISELTQEIENRNDIKIDKYALISKENLTMIFGEMGHITTEIPENITLTVSEGTVNISKGKQELDYEEICDYLLNGCKTDNKLIFQGDLICEIMEQYIENFDYSNSADTFSELINYVDTDISVIDYTENQDVIASFENTDFTFINTLNN